MKNDFTINGCIRSNQSCIVKYGDEFQRTFGRNIKIYFREAPNIITGFDICRFDRDEKAGDKSLRQHLIDKYGRRAADLIQLILQFPITGNDPCPEWCQGVEGCNYDAYENCRFNPKNKEKL